MMDEVHAMNELIIAGENWAASWKNVKKAKKVSFVIVLYALEWAEEFTFGT